MRTASRIVALVMILAVAGIAEEKFSDLTFVVVRATNGAAVRNASVVLQQVNKDGKTSGGGLQLKTDSDGQAGFNSVPYGKLRIQVIARGFQTFGDDFDINQPAQKIVIKLQPPKSQYSIYK